MNSKNRDSNVGSKGSGGSDNSTGHIANHVWRRATYVFWHVGFGMALLPFFCGCASKAITVTSNPPGAKAYSGPFSLDASTHLGNFEGYLGVTPVTVHVEQIWAGTQWAYVKWPDGSQSERKEISAEAPSLDFHFEKGGFSANGVSSLQADPSRPTPPELSDEDRQTEMARLSDDEATAKEIFKLHPAGHLRVADVNEALLTWKNRHLDKVLRNGKTDDLRGYVDEIEHTILQATDAAEREKDEAQRLIAAGAPGDKPHTDLARAYRLRIEVLKPILAAIKEEVSNRSK